MTQKEENIKLKIVVIHPNKVMCARQYANLIHKSKRVAISVYDYDCTAQNCTIRYVYNVYKFECLCSVRPACKISKTTKPKTAQTEK